MIELIMVGALLAQDPDPAPTDCHQALTTLEINDCVAEDLRLETVRMEAYLDAAIGQVRIEAEESGEDAAAADDVIGEIRASQDLWGSYAERACDAVYTRWQAGTIRVVMALNCQIDLTRERTHYLWREYLPYPDSTPAVLPEPVKAVSEEGVGD